MAMTEEMLAKLRQKYEQQKRSENTRGSWYWTPKSFGQHTIRFLPSQDPNKYFFKETGIHKIDEQRVYCPKFTNGENCPICEAVKSLYERDTPEDAEHAKQLKVQRKFYSNVVVRGKEDEGVKIYSYGIQVHKKVLGFIANPEWGDITDLKEGYDFIVDKQQGPMCPNYDSSYATKNPSSAGTPKEMEDWMNGLHDIYGLVDKNMKSYDELRNLLMMTPTSSTSTRTEEGLEEPTKIETIKPGDVDENLLNEIRNIT